MRQCHSLLQPLLQVVVDSGEVPLFLVDLLDGELELVVLHLHARELMLQVKLLGSYPLEVLLAKVDSRVCTEAAYFFLLRSSLLLLLFRLSICFKTLSFLSRFFLTKKPLHAIATYSNQLS